MQDLKDVTNNALYENYRCQKLAGVVSSPDPKNVQQAPSRCVWVGVGVHVWVSVGGCVHGWVVYMCMCVLCMHVWVGVFHVISGTHMNIYQLLFIILPCKAEQKHLSL